MLEIADAAGNTLHQFTVTCTKTGDFQYWDNPHGGLIKPVTKEDVDLAVNDALWSGDQSDPYIAIPGGVRLINHSIKDVYAGCRVPLLETLYGKEATA